MHKVHKLLNITLLENSTIKQKQKKTPYESDPLHQKTDDGWIHVCTHIHIGICT